MGAGWTLSASSATSTGAESQGSPLGLGDGSLRQLIKSPEMNNNKLNTNDKGKCFFLLLCVDYALAVMEF